MSPSSAALARGVPTLVVDLDPQADATMALNVDVPQANVVADVLSNPRRKTVVNAIVPTGSVVTIAPCEKPPSTAPESGRFAWRQATSSASRSIRRACGNPSGVLAWSRWRPARRRQATGCGSLPARTGN